MMHPSKNAKLYLERTGNSYWTTLSSLNHMFEKGPRVSLKGLPLILINPIEATDTMLDQTT